MKHEYFSFILSPLSSIFISFRWCNNSDRATIKMNGQRGATSSFRKRQLIRQKDSIKESSREDMDSWETIHSSQNRYESYAPSSEISSSDTLYMDQAQFNKTLPWRSVERQDTEDNITEEEFLRELQQTCLKKLRNYLCDHLEPERFFPYLQSKEYLDTDSCEQIRNMDTTRKRVNKMLDILIKSGTRPLEVLTRAIKKCGTTQKFICDKLENEYRRVREDPKNYERLWTIRNMTAPPPYTRFPINYYPGNYPPPSRFDDSRYPPECPDPSQFTNDTSISKTYIRSKSEEPSTNPANIGTNTGFRYRSTSDGVNNQRQALNSEEFRTGSTTPGVHPTHGSSMFPRIAPQNGDPSSSVLPQSWDGASHFNTSDFQSRVGGMNEILRSQAQQEEKLSLQNTPSSTEISSISDQIISNQEKEMLKYSIPSRNPHPLLDNWHRPSRKPREHDASMPCSRSGDVKSPVNHMVTTPKVGALANPPKNLPRLQSCQAGSIQPSCFNSANFEDVTSYAGPIDNGEKRGDSKKTPEAPPMPHLGARSTLIRSPWVLETIQSLQIPSEASSSMTNGTSSIQIRRPPTEHDDTSVVSSSNFGDEEDVSSLEISSDSE